MNRTETHVAVLTNGDAALPGQDSTLAYRVVAAYAKLTAANDITDRTANLLIAWSRAYPQQANAPSVLEVIGHLSRSVRLLRVQIDASTRLRAMAKKSATDVLGQLEELIRATALAQGYATHHDKASASSLGVVESVGATLAVEFPEPDLADEEAKGFHAELTDLGADIGGSGFQPELKTALREYIGFLLWAIENRDTMSSAMVRDTAAAVLMTVMEARALAEKEAASPSRDERLALLARTGQLAGRVARAMFRADVLTHGLLDAAHDVGMLLISSAS